MSSGRWARRIGILVCTLLLLVAVPASLEAAVFTVGSDGACSYSTITAALFASLAAGNDEIRIARNQTYSNVSLHLTDWSSATVGSLTLAGGYDNCADATPSGLTTLTGSLSAPVVKVDTSSQADSLVTLRDLMLNGSGALGVWADGGAQVTLTHVTVQSNGGGGIGAFNGATILADTGSSIGPNSGSGVACLSGSHVELAATVDNNIATNGAGILAGTGCSLTVHAGGAITNNDASFGGGIHASGGATVIVDGSDQATQFATQVSGNTATDQGGGIYASGAGTTVTIRNARVRVNQAGLEGGAIWADQGARVIVDRVSGRCYDPERCSDLSLNQVTQANLGVDGAVAWVESDADLEIYQTLVEGNSIDVSAEWGSLFYAFGVGSTIKAEGLSFWNNQGPDALFSGSSNAEIHVGFVSASGNFFASGTLPARPVFLSTNATATLNSSIFYPNSAAQAILGASLPEVDCLILSNTTGLPPSATFVSTVDPAFVDAANGNLALRSTSPAIDYCDTFLYSPLQSDLDLEARGYDAASNSNGTPGPNGGTYDLGADELYLFWADGYEAGNTLAWSARLP